MGIFSSLKRLFFVTESVAKSAAEKSKDYVVDKAEDIGDKTREFVRETKKEVGEKTSGLRESISEMADKGMDKARDLADSAAEKAKDVGESIDEFIDEKTEALSKNETVKKAMDFTEEVGESVMRKSSELVDKAQDFAEEVGKKVLSSSESVREKAQDVTENIGGKIRSAVGADDPDSEIVSSEPSASEKLGNKIGEKLLDAKEAMAEKALEATEKMEEKLKDLTERAMEFKKEEDAKPKKEFADETLNAGGSLLEGKDDFFKKAEQWVDKQNKADNAAAEAQMKKTDIVRPVDLPGEEE